MYTNLIQSLTLTLGVEVLPRAYSLMTLTGAVDGVIWFKSASGGEFAVVIDYQLTGQIDPDAFMTELLAEQLYINPKNVLILDSAGSF